MFNAPYMKQLSSITEVPQIRLGLQGMPGVGKTWAALTFPNPIVLNLDRGLGAHFGRSDVYEVPFYNPAFVDSILKRSGSSCPPNRRDAVKKWLTTDALKLTNEQTLVIDGSTGLQNAYEAEYNVAPVVTKSGTIDEFAVWRMKVEYFGEIMESLKALQCNVVYICHETPDRDKKGELNGLVRPLMTGQFGDQLASHFTDWFRCHAYAKPAPEKQADAMKFFGVDQPTLTNWIHFNKTQTMYLWQTQSDGIARGCKTSTLVGAPKFILADYSSFSKYRRSVSTK